MPISSGAFDEEVGELIRTLQPRTVLDIGAGAGKYGRLIKDIDPSIHVTAIEPDAGYVEQFGLAALYDQVRMIDAEALIAEVDRDYDLVIFGDVIEHMRKSVGLDLLNFFVYRARAILVIVPLRWRQGTVEGRSQEAHISVWRESDFHWCEADYAERGGMAWVKVRGFIGQPRLS